MEIPIEEFKKLKSQVSGIEDILHEVHGAIVGNPLSKDGGMQARLFQAEKDIEVLSKHVDEMEKKQIKDLLNTEKGQLKTSIHTTIMWSALTGAAALIFAYIMQLIFKK